MISNDKNHCINMETKKYKTKKVASKTHDHTRSSWYGVPVRCTDVLASCQMN